jgi:hypothetical protein
MALLLLKGNLRKLSRSGANESKSGILEENSYKLNLNGVQYTQLLQTHQLNSKNATCRWRPNKTFKTNNFFNLPSKTAPNNSSLPQNLAKIPIIDLIDSIRRKLLA